MHQHSYQVPVDSHPTVTLTCLVRIMRMRCASDISSWQTSQHAVVALCLQARGEPQQQRQQHWLCTEHVTLAPYNTTCQSVWRPGMLATHSTAGTVARYWHCRTVLLVHGQQCRLISNDDNVCTGSWCQLELNGAVAFTHEPWILCKLLSSAEPMPVMIDATTSIQHHVIVGCLLWHMRLPAYNKYLPAYDMHL